MELWFITIVFLLLFAQRMQNQQFNTTGLQQQQNSVYQPIPQQQPPTTFQHSPGYGNLPMFYNQAAAQQQRPPSTGQQTTRQKQKLKITDPTTGKEINLEGTAEHSGGSSDSGSRSTPVSGSSVEVSRVLRRRDL